MPESNSNAALVAVIGGGISGLACAFRLKQLGVPFVLLEKSNRFGGVVQTIAQNGFLYECGPQSFLLAPALAELIEAAGLSGELVFPPGRMNRYVYFQGELVRAPMSPLSLIGTPLLDAGAKWRLLTEGLRHAQPPESDESVADFVRRKAGASLLENLVGPFLSGVYAGDPEKLSLRSVAPKIHEWESTAGSVVRGALRPARHKDRKAVARPKSCSLRRGAESLMQAIGRRLEGNARLGAGVQSIRRIEESRGTRFTIEYKTTAVGGETVNARAVVVACDAEPAGQMLSPLSAAFPSQLAKIPYAPIAVVSLAYRREAIGDALDGFGFLVTRAEGLRLLGTVWNSSLFPERAPAGHVLLTNFAGGATDREICDWPDDRIAQTIHEELARILTIREQPVARHVRVIPRAIPQYNIGHSAIVSALRAECAATPGVFLCGNYLEGPSLGACAASAFRAANDAAAFCAGG
jgi:protoporphyrinogen/coproporphyrinogen III oxidase